MLYDCRTTADRDRGIAAAVEAVKNGELVVMPTDTVYGVGADAFTPHAITSLHHARGVTNKVPPPVLVGSRHTLDGLVYSLPKAARELADAFWPGALTLYVEHSPSLQWDLGDTGGRVAVRMPLHPVALEVLRAVGPMAVTTANKVGQPAPLTAEAAREQLEYGVRCYLEAGEAHDPAPSTVVDVTGEVPQVLRAGAIPLGKLRDVVPDIIPLDEVGFSAPSGAGKSSAED
ncbi:L-threonylcarbamoyladenylate synthase [Paractinoplanes brasiliensis]|uniref:L-threonylcarbamoyladenylate synthase n=1 Tax=Paractinoplanes brasiliensis TaxID=52695 RepID=A0A4V3C872_9ACTN|nr:L-threonylcarbamoyladenylate synthase [Actinoplanes brasiliensis]TDO40498.1 translation factor SUA5 [Actinoplanes brasiliensis]